MNDGDLAELLDRARPAVDADPELLASIWADVQRTPSRRRRPLVVSAIALGAVVAGVAAAPAAADFIAQSFLCAEGSTECVAGEEFVDLSGPEVDDLVIASYPDYVTLPPGMSEDQLIAAAAAQLPDGHQLGSVSLIQGAYENVAYCGWVDAWLKADAAGHSVDRDLASGELRASLGWPGPLQQGIPLLWQGVFADAADAGDRDGIQVAARFNACPAWDGVERDAWSSEHEPPQ